MRPVFGAILTVLACSSCASIIHGTSDTITINSLEPGTVISVDGTRRGVDVVSVDVKRGKKHVIRAEKKGFTPTEIQTQASFDGTTLLGIFIDFGIVSIPIDLISGAAWKLQPVTYTVTPIAREQPEPTKTTRTTSLPEVWQP
jgi:hypothetical protein